MSELNERIKKIRIFKKVSPKELADELEVEEKDVLSWEEDTTPEISMIVNIANYFGVTIDYLLTGKINKKISLDDMDEQKRSLYIIKNDDIDLFKKYSSFDFHILAETIFTEYGADKSEKYISAIYECESHKIFNYLLDSFLKNKWTMQKRVNAPLNEISSTAALVYGPHFQDFIKMCFLNNRVDALEFIKFQYFAIGNRTTKDKTYQISKNLFNLAFDKEKVNREIIEYVGQVHTFIQRDYEMKTKNIYYWMNDAIIANLYKNKHFELLNKALQEYRKNDKWIEENIKNGMYNETRCVKRNFEFLSENGYDASYTIAKVEPINEALILAKNNHDLKWLEIFNNYNKSLKAKFGMDVPYLDDDAMNLVKLEISHASEDQILISSFKHLGLVHFPAFIKSFKNNLNNVEELKKAIINLEKIKSDFLDTFYIHYCEMFEDLLEKKKYKELFEFSCDNNLSEMSDLLIEGKYLEAFKYVKRQFFINDSNDFIDYMSMKRNSENISELMSKNNKWISPELECEYLIKKNKPNSKNEIEILLKNQFLSCPGLYIVENGFVNTCRKIKETYIDNEILFLKNRIESITHENELSIQKKKIEAEINRDYIENLLATGDFEKAILKIAILLEAKLKFMYASEPKMDLKDMIDKYISENLRLHNVYDDEDDDYYRYQDEDRKMTHITKRLQQLRIARNNVVHSNGQKKREKH